MQLVDSSKTSGFLVFSVTVLMLLDWAVSSAGIYGFLRPLNHIVQHFTYSHSPGFQRSFICPRNQSYLHLVSPKQVFWWCYAFSGITECNTPKYTEVHQPPHAMERMGKPGWLRRPKLVRIIFKYFCIPFCTDVVKSRQGNQKCLSIFFLLEL